MIVYPNAKINLGLNVVEKRTDGFHNIETVFYPAGWKDALEIIEDKKNSSGKIEFSSSGIAVNGPSENNLVVRAYKKLDELFDLPPVKIHLHKAIPMGAGLGGGSSDAAFTLKLLDQLFSLNAGSEKLKLVASELGSDCAFFIDNAPAFATQKGDVFEKVNIDLNSYKLLIVWPGVHSNTVEAYSGIKPQRPVASCKEIIKKPVTGWRNELKNDFEETIFKKYPEVKSMKEKFYNAGAVYAAMSGSGSAVFGIFENEIPDLKWPPHYNYFSDTE